MSPGGGDCGRQSFSRHWLTTRPLSRSIRRLADTNGLVAALVVATYLGHPIQQMRPFPPTLYQRWGGQQCRLQLIPSRRMQTIGILVCPCHRPSNPSPSKVALQLTRGGDSMIPSATMASFFHRGSVHDESSALVVFVGATALEPPIHRSLVADADIGLGPPTYHPRPPKWWGFIVWDLLFGF